MEGIKKSYLEVVDHWIEKQSKDGSMPAGHNGPYYDPETPIRNTSHWAISFAKAYQLTEEKKYKKAMIECLHFLLKPDSKYYQGFTFLQREKKGKDAVNGVIGPAWNIEAFVEGYKMLGDIDLISKAIELYHILPFDNKAGLWKRRLFDGAIGEIDFTFNHQLWFCASGCQILSVHDDQTIKDKTNVFFNRINKNLRIHRNGLIKHGIRNRYSIKEKIKNSIKPFYELYLEKIKNKSMVYKENGYHLFNLYAFALIKKSGFYHSFFNSKKFNRIISYAFNNSLSKKLEINYDDMDITGLNIVTRLPFNRYGYAYNAPGFEIPFIQKTFNHNNKETTEYYFKKQISLTYNPNKRIFNINTDDPLTLTARIYELSRYFE